MIFRHSSQANSFYRHNPKPETNGVAGRVSPKGVNRHLTSKPPDILQHLPRMTFHGNTINRVDQLTLFIDNKG